MKFLCRRQVKIGHRVAADNEKRLASLPEGLCLTYAAGSSERFALLKTAQPEPFACRGGICVSLARADHIPEIAGRQRRFGNTVPQQQAEDVLEHGYAAYLYKRLRHCFGYRAEPCALAARHNYSFHTVIDVLSVYSCAL